MAGVRQHSCPCSFRADSHSAGLTTGFPCHFQRFHGEPAVRRERHGSAHWFSCEQVANNGEVRPALTRPDTGYITAPDLALSRQTAVQGS